METNAQPHDEFVVIGIYSIVDARRLLTALDAGKINYHVEFHDGVADINPISAGAGGTFGQAAQAMISIASEHKEAAERIHTDVFGDCLPNYEATFFAKKNDADSDAPPRT